MWRFTKCELLNICLPICVALYPYVQPEGLREWQSWCNTPRAEPSQFFFWPDQNHSSSTSGGEQKPETSWWSSTAHLETMRATFNEKINKLQGVFSFSNPDENANDTTRQIKDLKNAFEAETASVKTGLLNETLSREEAGKSIVIALQAIKSEINQLKGGFDNLMETQTQTREADESLLKRVVSLENAHADTTSQLTRQDIAQREVESQIAIINDRLTYIIIIGIIIIIIMKALADERGVNQALQVRAGGVFVVFFFALELLSALKICLP